MQEQQSDVHAACMVCCALCADLVMGLHLSAGCGEGAVHLDLPYGLAGKLAADEAGSQVGPHAICQLALDARQDLHISKQSLLLHAATAFLNLCPELTQRTCKISCCTWDTVITHGSNFTPSRTCIALELFTEAEAEADWTRLQCRT